MKNNLKLLFVSLGCDKNLVDTEFMLGMLRDDGIEMTDDEQTLSLSIPAALSMMQKKKVSIRFLRWQN